MIFGYISTQRYTELEQTLIKEHPQANVFEFQLGDSHAFFLQSSPNKLTRMTYQDTGRLLLGDGLPVRHAPGNGYKIINNLEDSDLQKGFTSFIDTIISNVCLVFFEREKSGARITMSSSRAGPRSRRWRLPSSLLWLWACSRGRCSSSRSPPGSLSAERRGVARRSERGVLCWLRGRRRSRWTRPSANGSPRSSPP